MLLRFGVKNHLSIRDRQEFSFATSSLSGPEDGLIDFDAMDQRFLPVAVIYGANASGKSNIVSAFGSMREMVLYSHSKGEPGGGVPRKFFALNSACARKPTIFDIDFVADGTRYHYGFEATDDAFIGEWLFAFPNNRRQLLFERTGQSFVFGRSLKGRKTVISELTRSNSLFLSAAAQNDHEQLSIISEYFRSVRTERTISLPGAEASMKLKESDVDSRVIEFLKRIGTGVVGYRKKEVTVPEEIQHIQKVLVAASKEIAKSNDEKEMEISIYNINLELAHLDQSGKEVFFSLDRESAGTRRLLILLGRLFRVLDEGALLVVDELDASLHTQVCESAISLFSSREINKKGAQLIATTHDTNLLRSPLLRRDQIWFTEKDVEGATHLFPLTDIRTREGDNIEKGYLQGRFGAIPFSGPPSRFVLAD